jgi:hypothetical protein
MILFGSTFVVKCKEYRSYKCNKTLLFLKKLYVLESICRIDVPLEWFLKIKKIQVICCETIDSNMKRMLEHVPIILEENLEKESSLFNL